MSNSGQVSARSRYLSAAADLLQSDSITCADNYRQSAVLLQKLSGSSSIKSVSQSCPTCGSVKVEAREVVARKKVRQPSARTPALAETEAEHKLLLRKCQKCLRTTKREFARKPMTPVARPTQTTVTRVEAIAKAATPPLASAKVSSKKRAKERRDREGLRAMLDKNKTTAQTQSSLGLLDFMSGVPK